MITWLPCWLKPTLRRSPAWVITHFGFKPLPVPGARRRSGPQPFWACLRAAGRRAGACWPPLAAPAGLETASLSSPRRPASLPLSRSSSKVSRPYRHQAGSSSSSTHVRRSVSAQHDEETGPTLPVSSGWRGRQPLLSLPPALRPASSLRAAAAAAANLCARIRSLSALTIRTTPPTPSASLPFPPLPDGTFHRVPGPWPQAAHRG